MARTDSPWEIEENYLQTTDLNGYDILINGLNRYLNFNVLNGILGYGFRDNNGTMEFKNSGGAWDPIISEEDLSGLLKLNQTTPQSVINGVPYIVNGIKTPKIYPNADSTTAFQINKADGTTNVLNIDTTNGRIGIGTTSPQQALEINGNLKLYSASGGGGLILSGNAGATGYSAGSIQAGGEGQYWYFLSGISGNSPYMSFTGKDYVGGLTPGIQVFLSPANSVFEVWNGNKVSSAFKVVSGGNILLNPTGNVGIGTTAPASKVSIGTSVANPLTGNILLSQATPQLFMEATGQAVDAKLWDFLVNGLVFSGRAVNDANSSATNWLQVTRSGATISNVLFPNGNVGIGTTVPGSKLTVNGHIGTLGTIPTLTSAGTGASITTGSTDTAGEITEGTSATGAVITFATAYTNVPFAIVVSEAGLLFSYTVSTTRITITNIGALSSTKLSYHVIARE